MSKNKIQEFEIEGFEEKRGWVWKMKEELRRGAWWGYIRGSVCVMLHSTDQSKSYSVVTKLNRVRIRNGTLLLGVAHMLWPSDAQTL